MGNPLVSVIVPTRDSELFIAQCLTSISNQSYRNVELIVVDNNSVDSSKQIALKFTTQVFNEGPERSAQRNYGARMAKGEYLLMIDSDMELSPSVIGECVQQVQDSGSFGAVTIPEESAGEGFWAQCKKLERSFYLGIDWIEAPRFFAKEIFELVGGYNENMVGTEDWELACKTKKQCEIGRTEAIIIHNEGEVSLRDLVEKKLYYARTIPLYLKELSGEKDMLMQTSVLQRYKLFLSQPRKLLKNPLISMGMFFMKGSEFAAFSAGYLMGKMAGHGRH